GLRAYIAILLAAAIAPIGIVGIVQTAFLQQENDALRNEAYVNATIAATARETRTIAENFGLLASISAILPLTSDQRTCNRLLRTLTQARRGITAAMAADADGRIICRSLPDLGPAAAGGPAMAVHMAEEPRPLATLTRVRMSEGDDDPTAADTVLVMAHPIMDEGRYIGFVTLAAPRRLSDGLDDATLDGDADTVPLAQALFDRYGAIFTETTSRQTDSAWASEAASDVADTTARAPWLPAPELLAGWAKETPGQARRHVPADGVARAYVVLPIIEGALNTLVAWPVEAAERAAASRFAISALFPVAMWIIAVAIAFFAVNALVLRNVLSIARVMHAFSIGRRTVRVAANARAPSELAALGDTFNRLADRLVADEKVMAETIEEKNTLLKEVYHRVKNNLQLIVSIANLQIREASDESERATLRRLQSRVQGLALVHQRLYEARSLAAVRLDLLLDDLLRRIREVQEHGGNVDLSIETEPLTFDPDRAVPLALFASEAIENAFKHGIGPGGGGRIGVTLRREGDDQVRLEIDNSLQPDEVPAERGDSGLDTRRSRLGTRLLEAFARQLGGEMTRTLEEDAFRVVLNVPLPETDRETATA
ncbi:MAG: sensor histidine kinase, partial [Pseudomonadota bacterium]